MAVEVETTPRFHANTPKVLFEGTYRGAYDVTPDGKRFLMIRQGPPTQRTVSTELRVIVNWFEELRRRAPAGK